MIDKTFDLIVEGGYDADHNVLPNFLHLTRLVWNGDSPPDVVVMEGGTLLYKVGRYASEGDKYCYRVAVVGHLVAGRLAP